MRFTEKQWRELFKRYNNHINFSIFGNDCDMISIHIDCGSVNIKAYNTMLVCNEGWTPAKELNEKHPFASTDDTQYAYFTENELNCNWMFENVIGKSMPTKKETLRFEMKFPIDFIPIDDISAMSLTVTDAQIASVKTEGEFANT